VIRAADRLKQIVSLSVSDIAQGNNPTTVNAFNLRGQVPIGNTSAGVTLLQTAVVAPYGASGTLELRSNGTYLLTSR